MKYLLLLNGDAASVESWRRLSQEEARKLRQQEIPQWNELFSWIGEQGLEVEGLELDEVDKAGALTLLRRMVAASTSGS